MHSLHWFRLHRLRGWCAPLRLSLCGALGTVVWLTHGPAHAQSALTAADPAATTHTWRQANEAVARFPRGHADVLKAEATLSLPSHRPIFPILPDPQTLQRAALLQRIDLWGTPADNALARLQRQQAVATWSRDVLQAWWRAAAAREEALLAADQAESTRLATELAHRMEQVGNWSEMRRLQLQRTHLIAVQDANATRQTAQTAYQALQQLVMLEPAAVAPHPFFTTEPTPAPWPAAATIHWAELPPPPSDSQLQEVLQHLSQRPDWQALNARHQISQSTLAPGEWAQTQQRMAQRLTPPPTTGGLWITPPEMRPTDLSTSSKVTQAWNDAAAFHALRIKLQTQTHMAWQNLQAAHVALRASVQQALPATQRLEEEIQRRANGMLASTWDVLAAQRTRADAERTQVRTQRDWQLAWLDWQAVLAGAEPTLTPPTNSNAAPAEGH